LGGRGIRYNYYNNQLSIYVIFISRKTKHHTIL
jgi:hypothetical protein